jgi:hypothetical protein
MDYLTCDICGAAVVDTARHRTWHDNAQREIKKAIDDALDDVGRKLLQRARAR